MTTTTTDCNRHFVVPMSRLSGVFLLSVVLFCSAALQTLHAQNKRQIFEGLPSIGLVSVAKSMVAVPPDTSQPELRLGLFTGAQVSNAEGQNLNELDIHPESRSGFHVGARIEMEFTHPLFLLLEVEYAQKGIRSSYVSNSGVLREEEFKLNYVDIPLLLVFKFPLVSDFALSTGVGAHMSFESSQVLVTQIADQQVRQELGLQGFDFGLEGRAGLIYSVHPQWDITADFRYLHGLQNLLTTQGVVLGSKQDELVWKSRSMFVSAGISYELQRSIR